MVQSTVSEKTATGHSIANVGGYARGKWIQLRALVLTCRINGNGLEGLSRVEHGIVDATWIISKDYINFVAVSGNGCSGLPPVNVAEADGLHRIVMNELTHIAS